MAKNSYCFGCQPFFVKASLDNGSHITLAFPSFEAAYSNANAFAFEYKGDFHIYIVDRANKVLAECWPERSE